MEDITFINIASEVFKTIESLFPSLEFDYDYNDENVDLSVNIRKQRGLDFDINLNLQSDELHISTKYFWGSWFTITNSYEVEHYKDAVAGLLSGKYRIVQYWDGQTLAKSLLQKPSNNKWQTIYIDRRKIFFLTILCSKVYIQNRPN